MRRFALAAGLLLLSAALASGQTRGGWLRGEWAGTGYQTDSIRQFTLVTSVYECCFGQPPGVEHAINVVLPEGRAVTFTYGEVQVTGTLRVEEEWRDGFVVNLFTIEDVTSVKATGNQ